MTDRLEELARPAGGGDPADEFLSVRPDVVRALRGGNAALLYALVEYRCRVPGGDRVEDGGGRWWRATQGALSHDTGLTVDQVRKTVAALQKAGVLEVEKHRTMGSSDHTASYRVLPLPAIRSIAHIESGDRPKQESGDRPHLSSLLRS
ncbi:hypothetical protein [Rhodococcoides kroppenstedtii]|uniref:hypothetical protein n=1 Tax=Rhodococcoides kroppenstedtii TaxID=293050 RepID=UPI00362E4F01